MVQWIWTRRDSSLLNAIPGINVSRRRVDRFGIVRCRGMLSVSIRPTGLEKGGEINLVGQYFPGYQGMVGEGRVRKCDGCWSVIHSCLKDV